MSLLPKCRICIKKILFEYNNLWTRGQVMDVIIIIILGIVQGLTEFLPVSSSGHLVLLENIFNIENSSLFINVVLHFATLLAVVIYYRKQIWQLIKHPIQPLALYLIISTIITCSIVLLFADFFESTFSGVLLAWGFFLSALFLFATEYISRRYEEQKYNYSKVNIKHSIFLGIFQGLAILPGVSRSGTTLCAGIVMGINKKDALDYSFLMSIPIIIASLVYELIKADYSVILDEVNVFNLILGGVVAFVFAILGIKVMLKVVEKIQYKWFALYLLILGIITIFVI